MKNLVTVVATILMSMLLVGILMHQQDELKDLQQKYDTLRLTSDLQSRIIDDLTGKQPIIWADTTNSSLWKP